jgi:Domain of unknown function (DUF5916)/Carbohydrate family 9 binding domain-like
MTNRRSLIATGISACALFLATTSALAQSGTTSRSPSAAEAVGTSNSEPNRAQKQGKVLHALRISGTPPSIDGRLSDETWRLAEVAGDLTQRDPDNGKPMTDPTRVQIAFDDRFLYVAVSALDSTPANIAVGLGRRDETPPTDTITIGFDARHDHQTAYSFSTNPSSWQGDFTFYDDTNRDNDYNAVWDVRSQITETGWTAEYRIPFSQMRFSSSPDPGQIWGFNIQRYIRRKSETGTWVAKPRGERGEVSFFGHIVFDERVPEPRRLELMPYVLSRGEFLPQRANEGGAAAGFDARMGLGTGATLSATFNPDFGQVEQDPAVLNLSVFETFFPEKRPFFLEDSRTFVPPYGLFQLFHSRRIGRSPGRLPLSAGERRLDAPAETTILGATKLTGKGGGWTYGAMTALTSREYATVESPVSGADGTTSLVRAERLIEPATSYNVARIQRDVMNGSSNVGAIVTGVLREQTDDAFTGGFDYNLRWNRNRSNFNGHWVVTRAPGPGGIKTSGGGVANINYGSKHLNTGLHYDHFGRDFRVNDIGFFRTRGNRSQVNGSLEVGNPDPWKKLRSVWGFLYASNDWTDEKLLIGRYSEYGVNVRFLNFWQVVGGGWRSFEIFDDLDTRGGPPILRPGNTGMFYRFNSDSRKRWSVGFYGNRFRNDAGNGGGTYSPYLSLQPSDRLQASLSLNYNYAKDPAQWIQNADVDGDGVTDHVYGTLDRDVVDLTVRTTYAFTRDLTVQTYLQPFVAVGDYSNVRRLALPKSFQFDPVTIASNPDFNTKSLRGNVVMRWEYKPGSTLFFVWYLSQTDFSRPGEFSPLRDLGSAFGADATHIFMVKASYWLNR